MMSSAPPQKSIENDSKELDEKTFAGANVTETFKKRNWSVPPFSSRAYGIS
jgi:hypothetical protein